MKRAIGILFFITISISSCTHNYSAKINQYRNPTHENTNTADQVLSITKFGIEKDNPRINQEITLNGNINFIERRDLGSDIAFKFGLAPDGSGVVVYHSPDAFRFPYAALEVNNVVSHFPQVDDVVLGGSQELIFNVLANDPESIDVFLKLRQRFAADESTFDRIKIFLDKSSDTTAEQIQNEIGQIAKDLQEENQIKLKEQLKKRKDAKEARKAKLNVLDNAPDSKQLKYLVSKNDRKGVVKLLRAYLPFEDMGPFEKKYWETMLKIIENPLPVEERVLVYRGLDGDLIYPGIEKGIPLSHEKAIENSNAFIMSTMLTKNQGSWNRRLRSLETIKGKKIAMFADSSEFSRAFKLSTVMVNHASTPQASPFYSVTPKIPTAMFFGGDHGIALLLDPRLIQYNFASDFGESEFLAPLISFPDETAMIWGSLEDSDAHELNQKIETHLKQTLGESLQKKIKRQSDAFFLQAMASTPTILVQKNATHAKANFVPNSVIPYFKKNGKLTCVDLMNFLLKIP